MCMASPDPMIFARPPCSPPARPHVAWNTIRADSDQRKGKGNDHACRHDERDPRWEIQRVCGEVFGLTVRSRNAFAQMGAGFKSMFGGELAGMTKQLTESRNEAMGRLFDSAKARGGNAISACGSTPRTSATPGRRSAPTAPPSSRSRRTTAPGRPLPSWGTARRRNSHHRPAGSRHIRVPGEGPQLPDGFSRLWASAAAARPARPGSAHPSIPTRVRPVRSRRRSANPCPRNASTKRGWIR